MVARGSAMPAMDDSAAGRPTTTRRRVLGTGLGALAAVVATALGRPTAPRGVDGQPIVIGIRQSATAETGLVNTSTTANVLLVHSASGVGIDAYGGEIGLRAGSAMGSGVSGFADTGVGVDGYSVNGTGVNAYSRNRRAVVGTSFSDTGLFGHTDGIHGTAGVFGESTDPTAYGSVGVNIGTGTMGILGAETAGVRGQVPNAPGLIGVHAFALEEATALSVDGVARFSRSGKASLARGRTYVDVLVPGGLSALSLVLAIPMVNRVVVHVQSAVPNPSPGKVRINLNKVASSSSSTPIAWFVVN